MSRGAVPSVSLALNRAHAPDPLRAFYQTALHSIRDSVAAVDRAGRVLFTNRTAKDSLALLPGDDLKDTLPELWPNVQCTLKDWAFRSNITFQKKNRTFSAKISPVSDKSSLVGAFCVIEDTTETENLLNRMWSVQELSKEYDAIFNSCSEGLWICDADANVIRINESSEKINKISGSDVISRNMRDLVAEGFIDRSGTLEALKSQSTANLIQYTRDGMKLMITAKPVYDERGRIFRVVVTEKDITEIETLHLELKEQTAIRDQFRTQMLEMQLAELESRRIIARSPCFMNVLHQAAKVSAVDSTVLILGESGAGKGLLAELIHKYSDRADRPMIKINCGAIPESLVESELFGYDRGAFTGAHKDGKPGYFELADSGILLLDEIVELPMSSQVKLLRFLEDSHITRVGGTVPRKLDIRVLAATNRDVVTAVANREFRLDLFYRLNVIPINIPPLRERKECILPLVHHYVEHFSKKLGIKKRLRFSSKASDALLAYSYPGNVRELMNLCERLVVMSERDRIDLADLPTAFLAEMGPEQAQHAVVQKGRTLQEILEAAEAAAVSSAMKTHGTQSRASRVLGVNQSTIARKLKKYGLTEYYTDAPGNSR